MFTIISTEQSMHDMMQAWKMFILFIAVYTSVIIETHKSGSLLMQNTATLIRETTIG